MKGQVNTLMLLFLASGSDAVPASAADGLALYVRPVRQAVQVDNHEKPSSWGRNHLRNLLDNVSGLNSWSSVKDAVADGADKATEVGRAKADQRAEDRLDAASGQERPVQETLRALRSRLSGPVIPGVLDLGTRRVFPLRAGDDGSGVPDFSALQADGLEQVVDLLVNCRLVKYDFADLLPTVEVTARLVNVRDGSVRDSFRTYLGKNSNQERTHLGMRIRDRGVVLVGHQGSPKAEKQVIKDYARTHARSIEAWQAGDGGLLTEAFSALARDAAEETAEWIRGHAGQAAPSVARND